MRNTDTDTPTGYIDATPGVVIPAYLDAVRRVLCGIHDAAIVADHRIQQAEAEARDALHRLDDANEQIRDLTAQLDTGIRGDLITIRLRSIAVDGLPDMDALTGRVAFIFDGCVISGWPLPDENDGTSVWEGNSDVGHGTPMVGVTHWLEFPHPVWTLTAYTDDPDPTPN
jgi:hypothetical protein